MSNISIVIGSWGSYNECNERALGSKWLDLDNFDTCEKIEEKHYKRQIIESNQQMIDNYDTLICYVNKKYNPNGAKLAINYTKREGLEKINLYDKKDEPTYSMIKEEKEDYYKKFFGHIQ